MVLFLELEDGLTVLSLEQGLDQCLGRRLGVESVCHAGVGVNKSTKFLDNDVCRASHISVLHRWDFQAVWVADSKIHLRPTAINRRNDVTVCLVSLAIVKVPEDRCWKVMWPHGRCIHTCEEFFDV
jgi:hypothetical protein